MKPGRLRQVLLLTVLLPVAFAAADGAASAPQTILRLWPYAPVEYEGTRKCPACGLELPDAAVREPDGLQAMAAFLDTRTAEFTSCDFIVPQEYERAAFDLNGEEDRAKLKTIAAQFGADAALYPVLLRYRERDGNRYAVSKPAAVVFHLHLMDAKNLEILWSAAYSEEQQPLSSNLLKFMQSYRRRFRWVTADRLMEDGLKKVFKDFPGCPEAPR
jgi:hypothetical protein